MGIVASDAAPDAKPALAIDRHDHLWCAYHTDADHLRLWQSRDYGATWIDRVDKSDLNYRFPRLAFLSWGMYLACYQAPIGNQLRVFYSDDYGATLASVLTITSALEQWPTLRADRRGILHLVYVNSAQDTKHRYTRQPGTTSGNARWETEETLDIGPTPAYYPGLIRGYAAQIDPDDASVITVYETAEDYGAPVTSSDLDGPLEFEPEQYPGVLVDHHEHLWVIAFLAIGGGAIGGVSQGGGGLREL